MASFSRAKVLCRVRAVMKESKVLDKVVGADDRKLVDYLKIHQ
jgi:hypothetical protein